MIFFPVTHIIFQDNEGWFFTTNQSGRNCLIKHYEESQNRGTNGRETAQHTCLLYVHSLLALFQKSTSFIRSSTQIRYGAVFFQQEILWAKVPALLPACELRREELSMLQFVVCDHVGNPKP